MNCEAQLIMEAYPRKLSFKIVFTKQYGLPGGSVVQNMPANNIGDTCLILGPGRSNMPQGNKAHVPQLLSPYSRA